MISMPNKHIEIQEHESILQSVKQDLSSQMEAQKSAYELALQNLQNCLNQQYNQEAESKCS